jgi:hypothetical protein
MRADLATSPKVVRIASALRADRLRVIGGLHAVWCLFDTHSTDGKLDGYSSEALDELIGFPGFAAAMVAVEWLYEIADGLATPRFDEHNGQSAKRRCVESERKREARKVSAPDADKVRSREEKRREEESKALVTAAANDEQQDESTQPEAKADRVPYETIFETYAATLPELPQPKIRDEARRRAIRSLWRSDQRFQSVDFWGRYYGAVRTSKFLMGMNGIGFDWLMKPANFKKVVEGNYQ